MKNAMKTASYWAGVFTLTATIAACATPPAEDTGALVGMTSGGSTYEKGVPGGVTTQVSTLEATVAHIDYKKRTVQLVDALGNRKTLEVGPEAVNFNQIKKGDAVKIAFVDELVVYLRDKGEPADDGAAGVAARAPAGQKPQVFVAQSAELTAVVKSVDLAKHTATLKFPDGKLQTVQVRPDVMLDKRQVGREVTFRLSKAMAISVEKTDQSGR